MLLGIPDYYSAHSVHARTPHDSAPGSAVRFGCRIGNHRSMSNPLQRDAGQVAEWGSLHWVALAAILLLGVWVRGGHLDAHTLDLDEAYSVNIASNPGSVISEKSRDAGPPGYALALAGWVRVFGEGVISARSLSVCAGLLTILMLTQIGTLLSSPRVGLIAAALIAVAPLHVHFSRLARPYAMFTASVTLFMLGCALVINERDSRLAWGATALGLGAALYLHAYGMLLGVALLVVAWLHRDRVRTTRFLSAGCVAGLAFVPWLPQMIRQTQSNALAWIEELWRSTPPSTALIKSYLSLLPGGITPDYLILAERPRVAVAVAGGVLILAFLASGSLLSRDRLRFLAVPILVSLTIVPYLISFLKPIFLVGRYEVAALPALVVLVALGIGDASRSRLRLILGGVLAALFLVGTVDVHGVRDRTLTPEREQLIRAATPEGSAVVCVGYERNALEYALRDRDYGFVSYPLSGERHRGWVDLGQMQNLDLLRSDALEIALHLVGPSTVVVLGPNFPLANATLLGVLRRFCSPPLRPSSTQLSVLMLDCSSRHAPD